MYITLCIVYTLKDFHLHREEMNLPDGMFLKFLEFFTSICSQTQQKTSEQSETPTFWPSHSCGPPGFVPTGLGRIPQVKTSNWSVGKAAIHHCPVVSHGASHWAVDIQNFYKSHLDSFCWCMDSTEGEEAAEELRVMNDKGRLILVS